MQEVSLGVFPATTGVMSDEVRRFDWSATPLGPMDDWPLALRMAVELVLSNAFPACLAWGPQLIAIHNDAFVPILGDKPAPLGRPFSEVWGEVWPQVRAIADRALAGEPTFNQDLPLVINRRGYPEPAWFTFSYSPVRDEQGQVMGFLDTVMETTDTIIAQRRTKELADSFERQVAERTADRNRLWQLSSDIILVTRQDLQVVALNPAWEQVLGWNECQLRGSSVLDLVHEDDRATVLAAAAQLARGESVHDLDCRLRHSHGGYRWINWAAVPGDGFFNAVGRDITVERERTEALRQAEELLRHSQKMEAVGQLTGGLAHDFNNLLTGITGSLELLRRRIDQGRFGELDRYLDAAHGAANRAATLTHRLLAFARRQTLDPRPTDVVLLVDGLRDLIRQTLGPTVVLDWQPQLAPWTVLVDPNQLESTVLNLCINARDAMPDGGHLVLQVHHHEQSLPARSDDDLPAGQYLCLSVIDSGTGMPPEVIARAFDPFFTTKPIGQGTGLGLSMVYGFARQSGGRVRIESTLGEGTAVRLYLPRHLGAAQQASDPCASPVARPARLGETVVLIDDEATLRTLVAEQLEEMGYEVLQAADGVAGLALLQMTGEVDLLITDVGLPGGLNGRQVADAAARIRPGLKVLFITGYAEQAVMTRAQLEPGMHLLVKPFTLQALSERVRAVLDA
ncbi:ATP-binding protein [Pseudomonas sp. App30]|uniref:ATP-binding protein n=1 Tax=Pseudomonas sp. App30 TaxID=3068990 RepID=UPI003A810F97